MRTFRISPIRLSIYVYPIVSCILRINAFTMPLSRRPTFTLTLARKDEENIGENRRDRKIGTRTREGGQSSEERELREMRYQEDYDDDDEDYEYDDEYDDDDYDDDVYEDYDDRRSPSRGEEKEAIGNFWSNPLGGMEDERREQRSRPQPSSRSRSRSRISRSNIPRSRGSNRKTFRSGNPPPPAILKDFYDKLFWYGFDADETTSAADRTMFGGTRGKFSGLGLLDDSLDGGGKKSTSRKGKEPGSAPRRRRNMDEYEDEYDNDYDGSYDDDDRDNNFDTYYDEDNYYDDEDLWEEDDGANAEETYDEVKQIRSRGDLSRANISSSPRSMNAENDIDVYDVDIKRDRNERRPPTERPRSRRGPERRTRSRKQSRRDKPRKKVSTTTKWFDDEDDYVDEGQQMRSESRSRRNDSRQEERLPTSPLVNILDKVFQVDPDEVKYRADDYNRKLGLDKKRGGRRSTSSTPRKGYAYRYVKDGEGDDYYQNDSDREEMGFEIDTEESSGASRGENHDSKVIDVEASRIQTMSSSSGDNSTNTTRQPKQQSWEDRASSYERVPPKGIKAWGPQGEIDGGIDARTYAARSAIEEISKMRNIFEKKEEVVAEAEKDLLQLKRESSIQKKKLLSEDDRRYSSIIRDELRKINFEIEDSARALRKAKGEAIAAIDKLEAIELRHWALLRQYEADQELEDNKRKDTIKTM